MVVSHAEQEERIVRFYSIRPRELWMQLVTQLPSSPYSGEVRAPLYGGPIMSVAEPGNHHWR